MNRKTSANLFLKTSVLTLPLTIYAILVFMINKTLRFPDIMDFAPLSHICILMEGSLKYCINNNWGFANPFLNYLFTQITGNLLLSQRIISAFFTLAALILSERIMTCVFLVNNKAVKLVTLLFILLSPWYIESIVSVHLDIAAITFILIGILMLNARRNSLFLLSGIIVSISYWFRFHFLIYAILFPLVVYFFNIDNGGLKKSFFCAAGILFGVSIPHILSFIAYGVFNTSDPKIYLADAAGIYNGSMEFAHNLEKMSYVCLIKKISIGQCIGRFMSEFKDVKIALFLLYVLLFILNYFISINISQKAQNRNFGFREWTRVGDFKIFILIMYTFVSVLPFIFIRSYPTVRHWSALFIVNFPILACIKRKYYSYVIIFLFMFTSLLYSSHQIFYFRSLNSHFQNITDEIKKVIPVSELKNNYNKILSYRATYNPYNKYFSFSPIVIFGWSALFRPYYEKLGRFYIGDFRQRKAYEKFDYIIFPKKILMLNEYLSKEFLFKSDISILAENNDIIIVKIEKIPSISN
jgi:hypothetical protein